MVLNPIQTKINRLQTTDSKNLWILYIFILVIISAWYMNLLVFIVVLNNKLIIKWYGESDFSETLICRIIFEKGNCSRSWTEHLKVKLPQQQYKQCNLSPTCFIYALISYEAKFCVRSWKASLVQRTLREMCEILTMHCN